MPKMAKHGPMKVSISSHLGLAPCWRQSVHMPKHCTGHLVSPVHPMGFIWATPEVSALCALPNGPKAHVRAHSECGSSLWG